MPQDSDRNGPTPANGENASRLVWVRRLATVFGTGHAPKAPGTFGTLWGIPLAFLFSQFGPLGSMLATLLFFACAVAVCELYERHVQPGTHDRSEIVIDEVAGYLVAFIWLPPASWVSYALAFAAFRFFDILKPYPISVVDQKVRGGFGVVADDIAAGVAASLVLQALLNQWNWAL